MRGRNRCDEFGAAMLIDGLDLVHLASLIAVYDRSHVAPVKRIRRTVLRQRNNVVLFDHRLLNIIRD